MEIADPDQLLADGKIDQKTWAIMTGATLQDAGTDGVVQTIRVVPKLTLLVGAAAIAGAALLGAVAPAHADPLGPGMCQYLGTNYPVSYPCDSNPMWLPYGTYDNPPLGSSPGGYPGTDCSLPMNQHNMGCS